MKTGVQNIAIILSAGRGCRMQSEVPKQYLDLCGMPVIAWSLKAFEEFDGIGSVILVSSSDDIEYCRNEIVEKYGFRKVRSIVPGGAERYLSVWEGLKEALRLTDAEASQHAGTESCEGIMHREAAAYRAEIAHGEGIAHVFIHDGARPMVDGAILSRCLEDVQKYGACVAGMPVKDTIKVADTSSFAVHTPDRRSLWQIQTPQAFSFPLIYGAYEKLIAEGVSEVTDDAMVVERETDVRVKLTEGSWQNMKITTPEDMEVARHFLSCLRR